MRIPLEVGWGSIAYVTVLFGSAACSTQPLPAVQPVQPQCVVHSQPPVAPIDNPLELTTVACDAEPTLHSTNGDEPALIRFLNLRTEPVELIWLDYDGKRKSYGLLDPGATRDQRTYLSHPWLIANTSGTCLDIRIPRATVYQATVR